MKFLSIAFVAAFLLAKVVTGAPPTTPNWSFQEIAQVNLKNYWINIRCVYDVIEKVMDKSDVKHLWHDTKSKMERLVSVEWKKCLEFQNVPEQDKCKISVIEKASLIATEFGTKLLGEFRLDLVREIEAEVLKQCLKEHAMFNGMQRSSAILVQFECMVDVLAEVSKENGLEELWSKSESQIVGQIEKWKKCAEAENKFMQFMCDFKEGAVAYKIVGEYIRLVATENRQVIGQFIRGVKEQCGHSQKDLSVARSLKDLSGAVERVKCIGEAISDAVKETDFSKIWEEYQDELNTVYDRLKACKNENDKWEAAKCASKEVQAAYAVFAKFTDNLKKANYETYVRIKEFIMTRCFN